MIKILFICHGNICRSCMAEFVMKDLVRKEGLEERFYIDSAAASYEEEGNDMYYAAKEKLREKGIPFERREARRTSRKDYDLFDVIYVMDENNQKMVKKIYGKNPDHKIHKLLPDRNVADPWYTRDFEKAYQDIEQGCRIRLQELLYD